MTPIEEMLSELERRAKAATPGPFDVERRDDDCGYMNYIVHGGKGDYAWCRDELDYSARHNAAFIAAANPATVLRLVEVAKAASAQYDPSPELERALSALASPSKST